MTRFMLLLVLVPMVVEVVKVVAMAEGTDSDLLIEIGRISQPYNCTLFLDNLEVRAGGTVYCMLYNIKFD